MTLSAKTSSLFVAAATLLAASPVFAGVTTFDFTGDTQGWHLYGTTATLSVAADSTFNTGNSLQISAGTTAAIYNFAGVTLANGDSLSIAFDFHFVSSAGSQGPRLFFGNQGDTVTNAATNADTSYYTGIGTSTGNANYAYNGSAGTNIAASAGTTAMAGTSSLAINDTASHRIVYTITNNSGYYDFLTTIDAGLASPQQKLFSGSGVATAATSNLTTFNTVGILQGATGGSSYTIDNVSITAVPEPSTYGLMGAGALAAVSLVRRRKSAKLAA